MHIKHPSRSIADIKTEMFLRNIICFSWGNKKLFGII